MISKICLVLLLAVFASARQSREAKRQAKREANVQDGVRQVTELQAKISTAFAGKNVQPVIRNLEMAKSDIQKSGSSFDPSTLTTAVTGVTSAVNLMQSEDPYVKAMGIMNAVSSIAGVVPGPYGAAISTLFSVASSLVSISSGNNMNTGQIIEAVVQKLLDQKHLNELREEIRGARKVLSHSEDMLNVYMERQHHTDTDMVTLATQVDFKSGLALLGKLEEFVERESPKAKNKEQIQNVLAMVKAYAVVSTVRQSMLSTMYMVYSHSNHTGSFEYGIAAVIRSSAREARDFVDFLIRPSEKNAHIAADFWPSKDTEISKLMTSVGTDMTSPSESLAAGCYHIWMSDYPSWYMYVYKFVVPQNMGQYGGFHYQKPRVIWKIANDDDDITKEFAKFKFKKNGDHFEVRNTEWGDWLWFAQDKSGDIDLVKTTKVSDNHLFKVVKTGSGKYYIANKKWLGYPVVSDRILLQGWYPRVVGDANPGSYAWWNFKQTTC